ncbi:MAG: 50S ribosomal protein L10 [Thermoplasmatales archaeon B_DKE]|nr:MAG: 50S ribosomal protein L10 [Thermoplasmatales archaeon B_DKE]QRF75228.1 rplP0_1 [Thermoplasmatales archaeon]
MRHPASWKVDLVKSVADEIEGSEVSAIASINGIRNNQLQKIRSDLSAHMKLKVIRKRLLIKALDSSKDKKIHDFKQFAQGQIAIITTDLEPAKLYSTLETTKQKAAARGGETAPEDIIIEAKETSFPPGPMISEFQKAGLTTAIEKGKIVIKKESLFVKKGEVISKDKAKLMEKLEIKPITVGLDILGAYSHGLIYSKEVLSITEEVIIADIMKGFSAAKAIALDAQYLVPEIIPDLLVKATINAEQLALDAGLVSEGNIELFILKAIREANAINQTLEGEEKPKESKKDDKKDEKAQEDASENVSAGLESLFG